VARIVFDGDGRDFVRNLQIAAFSNGSTGLMLRGDHIFCPGRELHAKTIRVV